MMQTKMGKIFSMALGVTVVSWAMAFVFGAMAGETVNSAMEKVEAKANQTPVVHEETPVDLKGVETVEIEAGSQDVEVQAIDGEQGRVEYNGQGMTGQKRVEVEQNGNRLRISVRKIDNSGFHITWSTKSANNSLKVNLPKSFHKDLRVVAHSGDIKVSGLKLEGLDINTSSGEIQTENCEAQNSRLHSSSGDMILNALTGKVEAEATSADITIGKYNGRELRLHTTSGEIEVTEPVSDAISASATSGDVKIRLGQGDESNWRFQLRANSGTIANPYGENPKAKKTLEIRTTSGDISITK